MIGVFRHGVDERAGYLEHLLETSGKPYRIFDLWEEEGVPLREFSHLVILGGRMSATDEQDYLFLKEEKDVIRDMVARCRPVLGICLGAQMIASALGARVYPCRKEIGWSPVTWIEPLPGIPHETTVFQWHGESFDLPPGARRTCSGAQVENQAFFRGSAWGIQFHIEVTREMIAKWTAGLEGRERILRDTEEHIGESTRLCSSITGTFLSRGFAACSPKRS